MRSWRKKKEERGTGRAEGGESHSSFPGEMERVSKKHADFIYSFFTGLRDSEGWGSGAAIFYTHRTCVEV